MENQKPSMLTNVTSVTSSVFVLSTFFAPPVGAGLTVWAAIANSWVGLTGGILLFTLGSFSAVRVMRMFVPSKPDTSLSIDNLRKLSEQMKKRRVSKEN